MRGVNNETGGGVEDLEDLGEETAKYSPQNNSTLKNHPKISPDNRQPQPQDQYSTSDPYQSRAPVVGFGHSRRESNNKTSDSIGDWGNKTPNKEDDGFDSAKVLAMRNLLRRDNGKSGLTFQPEAGSNQNTQFGTRMVLGSNTGLSGLPAINTKH